MNQKQINKFNSAEIIKDMAKIRRIRGMYIWESFMRKYDCQIVCEVGVQRGVNFSEMIKHNPKVAVAVDSWINDGVIARNDGGYPQEVLEKQYEDFKKSVSTKSFVKIYRDYSFNAVKHFKDNYFDLIYIDADHTHKGCLRDIVDWYPKVKRHGFLFGDDYRESKNARVRFGVIQAVNEFTVKNNLNFFELPRFGWAIIKK